MNTIQRLVWPLAMLLLAACGTAESPEDGRALDGGEATLAPDAGQAEPAEEEPTSSRFQLGTHYERLTPAQPTSSSPEKVEVAEIFWYGCPHCYEFEPHLERWKQQKADYVTFVRIPAVWNPLLRMHARAFYTAEALGLDEQTHEALHDALFAEIHENGNPLDTREALAALFGRFGVDTEVFEETFDSFDVHSKLERAEELNRRYGISSVPSIVVNGKYTSNGSLAGTYEQLIELIDELAAAERPAN